MALDSCSCTHRDSVFVASRHFNLILVDLQYKASNPNCLACVPFLITSCKFKLWKSSTDSCMVPALAPTIGGGHPKSTRALQLKRYATKWQKMSITSCYTQGLSPRQAEIQAVILLAVLLRVTGCELTVYTVVRAIAVATLLALPVSPESLVSGQLAPVAHAATVTACHTQAIAQRKSFLTLTPLLAWQRTWLFRFIQVGTGQRAGAGALIKMTILWTGKS